MKKTIEIKQSVLVNNAMPNRKVAALWTKGSNAQGLDHQESVCKEFAERYGISIKKCYGCMGVSAMKQEELLKAMVSEVAQDGEINAILVYSADRLSRNNSEVSELTSLLKSRGIDVISASDNNPKQYKMV